MPNSITSTSSQQMCPMVLMCGTVLLVLQLSLPLMTASECADSAVMSDRPDITEL